MNTRHDIKNKQIHQMGYIHPTPILSQKIPVPGLISDKEANPDITDTEEEQRN